MQERIFRFGLAGFTFILSILFWFWYIGGNINSIISINNEKIITVIIGIVSTPALGFIVSTIFKEIWEFAWPGEKYLFLNPEKEYEQEYLEFMFNKFPDNSGIKLNDTKYSIYNKHVVFLNQQILLRSDEISKEGLAWDSRRMDVVYAQIHGFYSVIIGLIVALILAFFLKSYAPFHFNGKTLLAIPVLIYAWIAYRQTKRALYEANYFEKRLLLHKKSINSKK